MKYVIATLFLVGCAARPNYAANFVTTVSGAKCLPWGSQGDTSSAMCGSAGSVFFCTATPITMPQCSPVSGPAARAAAPKLPTETGDAGARGPDDPPTPAVHPPAHRSRKP